MNATLEKLRRLEAAASAGPWELQAHSLAEDDSDAMNEITGVAVVGGRKWKLNPRGDGVHGYYVATKQDEANADLIAALRNSAPALLAIAEAAAALSDEVDAEVAANKNGDADGARESWDRQTKRLLDLREAIFALNAGERGEVAPADTRQTAEIGPGRTQGGGE